MLEFNSKVQIFIPGILVTLGTFLGCVQQSHMKTPDPVMTPPTVSQADRSEEIVRLKIAGLDGPSSGPVLAHPFKKPYTRRSFVCLLYTSPSPRDFEASRMPSSA